MAKRSFSRFIKILTGVHDRRGGGIGRGWSGSRISGCWSCSSFVRNRCLVRAAALSYTTLLALIPMLAVAISVTSSLLKSQGEEQIYGAIDKFVSNIMPPATVNTNNAAVSLNLSPGMTDRADADEFRRRDERADGGGKATRGWKPRKRRRPKASTNSSRTRAAARWA